ncbi:hypothetical protein N9A04_00875 [Rickettsiales bacterium]|nr:hypothetical protein [Rickettsiales bacterium]
MSYNAIAAANKVIEIVQEYKAETRHESLPTAENTKKVEQNKKAKNKGKKLDS